MLTETDMIEHYLSEADAQPDIDEPDLLGRGAVLAFAHMVDDVATAEDLSAYRAWITYQRLNGMAEDTLASALNVERALAVRLGLA